MNKITKKSIAIFLITVSLVLFNNCIFNNQLVSVAANADNNRCFIDPELNSLEISNVDLASGSGKNYNMGDNILVYISERIKNGADEELKNIDLKTLKNNDLITPNNLILYLNDYALNGSEGTIHNRNIIRFKLKRTDESQEAWNNILGGYFKDSKIENIGIGCPGEYPFISYEPNDENPISLNINNSISQVFYFIFLISLVLFLALCRDSLRDDPQYLNLPKEQSETENDVQEKTLITKLTNRFFRIEKGKYKPPFSLGRVQMAWWFFIIIGSFLFIFVRTRDFTHIINAQSLILMGISAGTGISSAFIDEEKSSLSSTESDLTQESKNTKIPRSSGFLKDITSTKNGVSFHRFQIVVWTFILGVIFLLEVINNLQFPEFDSTLLTLQGISAGTYLGFKLPEKPKSTADV